MKIDIIRKLPEHMDTIVVMQEENGAVQDVEHLSPELIPEIQAFLKHEEYSFAYADIKNFCRITNGKRQNIILLGAGTKELLNIERLRNLLALVLRYAAKLKAKQVFLFPGFFSHENEVSYGHVLAEAGLLSSYRFDKYQSDSKNEPIEAMHYVLNTHNTRHLNRGILEGRIFAEATNLARDMVNEPANVMTPEILAETAKKSALQYGLSVDVLSVDKLKRMKMDAFLAVGRGSVHEPRLIVLRYNGVSDKRHETIALVGKGLTYDSGGYCIKTPQGMLNMKNDMGGAAAVIGAMCAISAMKLKVNVVAVIAACENMISGDAYRAGDVLTSMSGKTIEVINTDAEGRLTLIDAIHYAIEKEHADRIIDIATLTGAAVGALGTSFSAVLTNSQEWLALLKQASEFTGELIWELPAHDGYKELIKSEIADLKNTGGPFAGAITAGLFLREFVQDKPWIHIDIAGSALRDKEKGIHSYGATGVGVRLLTTLMRIMEH